MGSHPQKSNFENSVFKSSDTGSSDISSYLKKIKVNLSLSILLMKRFMILI